MRAAAEHVWGAPTLAGRTVAIAGAGKVGSHLVTHLVEDGADVLITDVDPAAVDRVQARYPQVKSVPDTATLVRTAHDVYAPPARSAGRSTPRPWTCCPPGSCAAAPTTSWPRPTSPTG